MISAVTTPSQERVSEAIDERPEVHQDSVKLHVIQNGHSTIVAVILYCSIGTERPLMMPLALWFRGRSSAVEESHIISAQRLSRSEEVDRE
jgi:hypothetical protein